MLDSLKPRPGKRWPRGQKFALSTAGVAAEMSYRDVVATARAQGRNILEVAQRAWAEPLRVEPGDAVVLGELRDGGRKGITEMARALETCGVTQPEVKVAVDRLCDAGLVEPVAMAAQAAA